MYRVIPWSELIRALKPYYPDQTGPGRHPKGLERMQAIYFIQHRINLSDTCMEEELYESLVMSYFDGIDQGEEAASDVTKILSFP